MKSQPPRTNFSAANGLSRRDFLNLAGAGAAALALKGDLRAQTPEESSGLEIEPARLAPTHDLLWLPKWGPYSKKYFGISHVPDVRRGLSFDLSVFPVLTRGPVKLPSVTDRSGVHPWEAAPDLGSYTLRQELIWKDQLYCDLSFSQISSLSRLIRLELVNQTGVPHEIALNGLAQLVFPPLKELTAQPIRLRRVDLPPGAVWVDALDYADLHFATPRPTDNLVPDGKWRGEEGRLESVGGSVVAQGFGREAGDTLTYRRRLEGPFANATLVWRFQMEAGQSVAFKLDGAAQREIAFHGSGKFDTVAVPLGALVPGPCEWVFTSLGGAPIALNGFAVLETEQADRLRFPDVPWHPVPEIETLPKAQGLILKYEDVSEYYGFMLGMPLAGHRELKWRNLDAAFGTQPGPNTRTRIFGNPAYHSAGDPDSLFVHAFAKPFTLPPASRRVVFGLVSAGSRTDVHACLAGFDPRSADHERVHLSASKKTFQPTFTPAGESYKFSQRLMAATTLTGLVYPLRTQGKYIRHYSPGRRWDCLYTWDAGFLGLGLLEVDPQCAVESLNTYTTPPGAQSAFIHHGTPVPVQIYLFYEIWNRTQSRELLAYFYPRVRQYHLFLAGRLGSSTTRRHRDHLICTWDYFYNSGGWDDYPAQVYVHKHHLTPSVAPVANSAHTIRCAKMLRAAAAALGRSEDFAEYDEDIAVLSASLQKYSWDPASGYFGYVKHNERGEPAGILRTDGGLNFNMGIGGVYPLVAGICSKEQEQELFARLFSQRHLWMDIGITTVDQSAPYFNPNGYWNGSVWLAHQWFLWKSMLDLGCSDLAYRIAKTGVNLWKQATDPTYDCWEHFMPRKPYGAGWHQFTSLSSPALSWFAALYTPGRLTAGFDVWVEEYRFSRPHRELRAKLKTSGSLGRPFSLWACMNPDRRYRVRWNGAPAQFKTLDGGLLQIQLTREPAPGALQITPL